MLCPCCSENEYSKCCEPIILDITKATTPELLMRARYTAYTQVNMNFIKESHDPATRSKNDFNASKAWAESTNWKSLEIIRTEGEGADDNSGIVEFKANFETDNKLEIHHEISTFTRKDGTWFFTDGKNSALQTIVRDSPKVGRNAPCPCGSNKKYKKCCA